MRARQLATIRYDELEPDEIDAIHAQQAEARRERGRHYWASKMALARYRRLRIAARVRPPAAAEGQFPYRHRTCEEVRLEAEQIGGPTRWGEDW